MNLDNEPPQRVLSSIEKLRFYRDEIKHEFGLLATRATIEQANRVIHGAAVSQPQYQGMGTTVIVAVFGTSTVPSKTS